METVFSVLDAQAKFYRNSILKDLLVQTIKKLGLPCFCFDKIGSGLEKCQRWQAHPTCIRSYVRHFWFMRTSTVEQDDLDARMIP